LGNTSRFFLWW